MLKTIINNEYTNLLDQKRYLYSLKPKDLEQVSTTDGVKETIPLKRDLHRISELDSFKMYYLDGKTFFDSPKETFDFNYYEAKPYLRGVCDFLMSSNIHSDPLFKDDYLKINAHYFRFISVSFKDDHFIYLNDLQKYGDYMVSFKRIKTVFSKIMVNDARKMSHTSLYQALSDIEGIETYRENEKMLQAIISGEEELFTTEISFIVRSISEVDLLQRTSLVVEALDNAGLCPRIETVGMSKSLESYMPGIKPTFNKSLLFHSSLLLNTLSLHEDYLMKDGVMFHSKSDNELFFNSRTGDSFSICITGVTGKGKTVFTNKLIDHELSLGRKCLVFDPKGDYKKHALLKNAHMIDESINPMNHHDPMYFRTLLLSKIPQSERTALFDGKLLRAIKDSRAYEEKNFFCALDKLKPLGFKDLEYYFEDIRDKISEKKEEVSDFTYIEFSTFPDEMIPFLLSYSFEYLKRLKRPYNLIIDEAHRVFEHNPTFLEQRVREMRVQNASLIPITQKFSDLTRNYFGEVVADNCFHKIFFSQNIEKGKSIDDFDLANITSLKMEKGIYSEFYYKSDYQRKIMRYYPTKKELAVFSSDNAETNKLLNYIKKNLDCFSVDECINQWTRRKHV